MTIPLFQQRRIGSYIVRQMLAGKKRFPLVLMFEPLFRCNLKCRGCGKNGYPEEILAQQLGVEEALAAVQECGAPVVSLAGGEPLLHPDIQHIVGALVERKKFVYLCTNALQINRRHTDFEPSPFLVFNIHLDGLREFHDKSTCRKGVFDTAVEAIHLLLARGFRVTTNTTFFEGQTPTDAVRFFDFLSTTGVEAMNISPAFTYERAADQDHFLARNSTISFFREVFKLGRGRKWRFNHSGFYLDFLAGARPYGCSPWACPTRNIFGWQKPCYLLNDGYASSYTEMMETVDWERYGSGRDPRCDNCMVHSGYEPSAVMDSVKNPLAAMKASILRMRQAV